ncbi:MAG: hypothetical protein HGA45_03430 [Chloroflexales bacterium]|nr:hypothetical protein [Chloroflexales bacterium]
MSLPDASQLTLIGRTSAWLPHLPAGPADRGAHPPRPASGARPLLVSWVHHRSYGTIGVYLAAAEAIQGTVLRRGQWLHITRRVQPCLAYALPDDPRSALALAYTPLLLEVTAIRTVDRARSQVPQPLLTIPRQARVLPARPGGLGRLVPLAHWADAIYWHATGEAPAVNATWNAVRGVVTRLGAYRYLRYVLSWQAPSPT